MWCERVWGCVRRNATVPGAAVVFALVYIFMLAVDAGEVGAAWVQAIGSVAAICAAIWIASTQDRKRLEQEKANALEQAQKIASLAQFVGARVINACEFWSTPFNRNPELSLTFMYEVDECLALLMRVDLSHIPGAALTKEWFVFVQWVSVVADRCQKRAGKKSSSGLDELIPPAHFVQQGRAHIAAIDRAVGK